MFIEFKIITTCAPTCIVNRYATETTCMGPTFFKCFLLFLFRPNFVHPVQGGICRGGRGDVSWSLDFGIPPTGADSNVPGWDACDPAHWNKAVSLTIRLHYSFKQAKQMIEMKYRPVCRNKFLRFTSLLTFV